MFTAVALLYNYWATGNRHIWDIRPDRRENLALSLWLAEFSFLVCGGLTKVSVLLFYRRLVDGTYSRRWRWMVMFAIAFTIAYTTAFCIMLLLNCTPTEAYWRAFNPQYATTVHYTCLDTKVINTLAGVFAAASDVYAVALPCIITWHFSVPRAQKIALNVIFSLGLLVVAASGVRTYYLISKSHYLLRSEITSHADLLLVTGHESDVSHNIYNLIVWAQVELQLGIMCASAPSLRVFFRRYLGVSAASRALKSGKSGRGTPSLGNSMGNTLASASPQDRSITVVRSTFVDYDQKENDLVMNKKPFESSLETTRETASGHRTVSPTPSKEHLTRPSTDGESIPMQNIWEDPGKARWGGRF